MSVLGFCFLFIKVPKKPYLKNYCISRRFLAISYFSLATANLLHLFLSDNVPDIRVEPYLILLVASFQSFLFTYSLITLINIKYATCRKIVSELAFIVLIASPFGVSLFCKWASVEVFGYWLFYLYYVSLLLRYTFSYIRQERKYQGQMNNSFSDLELRRFFWIRFTFICSLCVGVLVFITLLIPNSIYMRFFTVLYVPFYLYFGIRYINYVSMFHLAEPVLDLIEEQEEELPSVVTDEQLVDRLERWVVEKRFIIPSITLGELASEINTNRTYLSSYINTQKKMNFNTWINYLRIEEAKSILLQYPELSVGDVARKVGYSEQGNFTRHFSKFEGISPLAWRKKQMS